MCMCIWGHQDVLHVYMKLSFLNRHVQQVMPRASPVTPTLLNLSALGLSPNVPVLVAEH